MARAPEQKDMAAWLRERLQGARTRASTRTARIVTRSCASCRSGRARSSSNRAVTTSASFRPSARTASRRNTDFLVFDSTISSRVSGNRQRKRDRRRASAAPDVQHARRARGDIPGRHDRFDQQAIQRVRRDLGELQPGQVDLAVPGGEEPVVGFELPGQVRRPASRPRAGRAG